MARDGDGGDVVELVVKDARGLLPDLLDLAHQQAVGIRSVEIEEPDLEADGRTPVQIQDAATGTRTAVGPTTAATTAPARKGSPRSAVDRVADFYGTYVDALRPHCLTAGLRADLAQWETGHHGVLRAKGVPIAWEAVHNDSGTGHCWTRVTLTWQDSTGRVRHTHLVVRSDLESRLVSGIRVDG